jgi:polysaccharide export outer membrane protein
MRIHRHSDPSLAIFWVIAGCAVLPLRLVGHAQNLPAGRVREPAAQSLNGRLEDSRRALPQSADGSAAGDFRIGPGDLLDIVVFEAPEMNCTVRVTDGGEIAMALLDPVKASGLTPRELESTLRESLRRAYMKDPHVGVTVRELQSHPVSVVGSLKQPGVFQIRGSKTLIEMLSMAQGFSDDAGDSVVVMHEEYSAGAIPAGTSGSPDIGGPGKNADKERIETIKIKELLSSQNSSLNVAVHPGDIVKVPRAGIVYVVGDVRMPGGFALRNNENISVLQALALAEGLNRTSAKSGVRIFRTQQGTEKRIEIPLDLGKIMASKAPDPMLEPRDIVFVPNSSGKTAFYRGAEAALVAATGVAIYGRY